MPIELLYIIPILAVVVLGFLLVMNAQKRSMEGAQQQMAAPTATPTGKLPGDTKFLAAQKSTEERLNEYEQTIAQINKSLSNQHMVIEEIPGRKRLLQRPDRETAGEASRAAQGIRHRYQRKLFPSRKSKEPPEEDRGRYDRPCHG